MTAHVNYYRHLKSDYWRNLRRIVFGRAGGWCEQCHKRRAKNLHHRHYLTLGFEEASDVLALCRECHEGWFHRKASNDNNQLSFAFNDNIRNEEDAA